jgi:[glutamine synthetase] adenylyltransferase / [glutamine synthetase]-adenylyl-L-tyrosine phosphorylase
MSDDKQITITPERLASFGVRDAGRALSNIELLSAALGAEGDSFLSRSLPAELPLTADPDMALNQFERFVSTLADVSGFVSLCRDQPRVLTLLMTISGASRFLSSFTVTDAEQTLAVFSDPAYLDRRPGRALLRQRIDSLIDAAGGDKAGILRAFRILRKREMLRIALRDLLGAGDLQETVAELSDLAEVCIRKAYEIAEAELSSRYGKPMEIRTDGSAAPAGFSVIAMGKLGGRELNFSSDVDLMYVYAADGETEGTDRQGGPRTNKIANHQYFIKLAERISALINEKTSDGFVFRVDVRLRPEGQQGPLAQSLGGCEIYYESWGQTWERAALIKARPIAGDDAVGREFLERIAPFVYRKYLDYGAITEISDMKRKINVEVEQKGRMRRDVKLGYGGIREIEFIVQALQLLHGGRDRLLRERSSLRVLHRLSQKGLLAYEEQESLAKAYEFLRTIEHRIQLLDDLQSQTMPADERELRLLARRAGYREPGRETESLLRDYAEHTGRVRRMYDQLFSFAGEKEVPREDTAEAGILLDPATAEQDAVAMLSRMGFRDPHKAHRNLLLLREGPAFVHQTPRSRRLFYEIFPALLREITSSVDSDMALHHLEAFLAAHGSWESLQSLVRIDVVAVRVLIAVFANSEYLSRLLVSRPDFLQTLLEARKRSDSGSRLFFERELDERLPGLASIAEKIDSIRHFKHQEEIRIGMADLLSGAGQRAVSRDLARLADACLGAALGLAAQEIGNRYDVPRAAEGLAIIALGKLGGRELTYGSDLDIFFVYCEALAGHSPAMSVFERFSKVAERTIFYLTTMTREGFMFRVDTRLRPMGSKGPLVQSVEFCRTYYAGEAAIWEHQALMRARFAAGDRKTGDAFCSMAREMLARDYDPRVLAAEIRAMRKRMEEETGRESRTQYNIKQGRGGIVDIEFLVQYHQLLHGRRHPRIAIPGTENALTALHKEKVLQDGDYRDLLQSCRFLRRLENRMRIVANQASSNLSKDPAVLEALARRMGYNDSSSDASAGALLLADYAKTTALVRSIFDRLLNDPGSGYQVPNH